MLLFVLIAVKSDPLRLSANHKKELFDFIKNTKNKEEYRRAIAVKQNMEGMSYRTIAKNLGVNYLQERIPYAKVIQEKWFERYKQQKKECR